MTWHLAWANVRHDLLSPAARAPGTPQDRARTMPPDIGALAGNDYPGRVLCGLSGANGCESL